MFLLIRTIEYTRSLYLYERPTFFKKISYFFLGKTKLLRRNLRQYPFRTLFRIYSHRRVQNVEAAAFYRLLAAKGHDLKAERRTVLILRLVRLLRQNPKHFT